MVEINDIRSFGEYNKNYNSSAYHFEDCIFNIEIKSSSTLLSISLKNCIFNKEVNFSSVKQGSILIKNCEFKKKANFSHSIYDSVVEFNNCTFIDSVVFNNSTFNYNVRFYSSKFFGKVNFHNAKFKNLADFWNTEFYKPTIFYKTDFLGTTVFSSAEFNENVLFTYTLIGKTIIFRGTIFKKGLDLSLAIFDGGISLFDIDVDNFKSVKDLERIQDDLYEEYVSSSAIITDKNKRETFRILKNQATSHGNNIYALKFSALEMKSYQDSLKRKLNKRKQFLKTIQDYFVLELNFWSNKHGESWFRGALFTMFIGALFLYFSLISTKNYSFGFPNITFEDFKTIIKYYFIQLTPTHKTDFLDSENPTEWFYLIDFFSRVFIAYGIYQTVQAFRKFKGK